jgi:[acyl-carrier-protein] S-malonyltransferase
MGSLFGEEELVKEGRQTMDNFTLVFPGQGSQYVGMGLDFYERFDIAKHLYNQANDILGFKLSDISFNGPESSLADTYNTQPAIYVASIIMYEVLKQKIGSSFNSDCVAGHSLGEYSALVVSDSLDFRAGLKLVRERARLMKEAGEKTGGGMLAVIGANPINLQETIDKVVLETSEVLVIANDNCPGQVVLSGTNTSLDLFSKIYKESGAKIIKRLPVSVACHSPLMESAQYEFDQIIDSIKIQDPKVPVCGNTTGMFLHTAQEIGMELKSQLCKSVLWRDSVSNMISSGCCNFIEIGPGQTLSGLIKRIDATVNMKHVSTINDLEQELFLLEN